MNRKKRENPQKPAKWRESATESKTDPGADNDAEQEAEAKTKETLKERTAKEPTIPLEFLAEFIASLLGNMHLFSGVRSPGDVLIRFNEIVADTDRYNAGVDRFESQMQTAIELASWLGAAAPETSNRSAEKRIHRMYAILRAVFFEAPWPPNPRIDSAQKAPMLDQNNELIEMALNLLRNVPCVREAIEAQRTAGTLGRWKIAQRKKSTDAYSKLRNKLSRKADEIKAYLSAELLEAPDSSVNTSEKNSGAENTDMQAPDTPSGATKAGNQVPATRAKKKRKKTGV
jgi:hypothetical protein